MDNLITHFKTREPQETINILKRFFEKRGCNLTIREHPNELQMYSHSIELQINNQTILISQGKGVSKDYSLASGLAELYERFCNKMPYIYNPFLMDRLENENLKTLGYHFYVDEKLIDFYDLPDIFIKYLLNITTRNNIQDFIKRICPKGIIGLPYKNFNDNSIIYLDPRLIQLALNSTGMSAGNDIYEALNQALSEWYERFAAERFFRYPQTTYYELDIDSISNQYLKEKCQFLNDGKKYSLKILDLSYNFNVPTLCILLTNLEQYETHVQFGSFPVFDIALERCLTEAYQSYNKINDKALFPLQSPYSFNDWDFIYYKSVNKIILSPEIPQNLFLCLQKVSQPSLTFLKNANNNKEIYDYYKKLNSKLELDFYYIDNSLDPQMKAISLICTNIYPENHRYYFISKISEEEKNINYNIWTKIYDFSKNIYDNKSVSDVIQCFEEYKLFKNIYKNLFFEQQYYLSIFSSLDFLNLYSEKTLAISLQEIVELIQQKISLVQLGDLVSPSFFKNLKKYFVIINFKVNSNLSDDEIFIILNQMYNNSISREDINKCENFEYILREGVINKVQNELCSDTYKDFIKILQYN